MIRNYIAFDIEIAKVLTGSFDDWKDHRPLGISCAATLTSDGDLRLWYGKTSEGEIADQMKRDEAKELIAYLSKEVELGKAILTWNGLGFDFDILAEESGEVETCWELALEHVDMMFHVFCVKGFGLGLDKAARGMGLPGKPPGMRAEFAPVYWAQGKRDEVLYYVQQDAKMTLGVAQAVEREGQLRWRSDRGSNQYVPFPSGWLTVREAMALPLPDTSWMRRPWSRSKFTSWLNE